MNSSKMYSIAAKVESGKNLHITDLHWLVRKMAMLGDKQHFGTITLPVPDESSQFFYRREKTLVIF